MWPHFQQFLHCGTSGFIFAPYTIKLPTLKHLLMIVFVLEPFCISHMSIHTMVMSGFGETFMILGLNARTILLKMWLFLRIFSILLDEIHIFEYLLMYSIPIILRYDLDWGSLGEKTCSVSLVSKFFMHFSISCRLEGLAILLVVMTIPLSSTRMKSVIMFDLIFLSIQFMLIMCMPASLRYLLATSLSIGIMTCFWEGSFVVMLRWGFGLLLFLLIIF